MCCGDDVFGMRFWMPLGIVNGDVVTGSSIEVCHCTEDVLKGCPSFCFFFLWWIVFGGSRCGVSLRVALGDVFEDVSLGHVFEHIFWGFLP